VQQVLADPHIPRHRRHGVPVQHPLPRLDLSAGVNFRRPFFSLVFMDHLSGFHHK
jgi:hypothetical protein